MRCSPAAVAGLLLLAACAAKETDDRGLARTDENPAAMVEALPPAVESVTTTGWWSDAGREGTYRIVLTGHGFDKLVSRLYVQWLEQPGDERTGARVLGTVGFDRVNAVPVYRLEVGEIRQTPDGLEVELTATSLYTDETPRLLLRAGPPGVATLDEPDR